MNLAQQTGIPKSRPAMSPATSSRALTPPYPRATSLNHRSDPAAILPNSNQGSQPQSIPISSSVFGILLVKSPGAMCEKNGTHNAAPPRGR